MIRARVLNVKLVVENGSVDIGSIYYLVDKFTSAPRHTRGEFSEVDYPVQ